MRLVYLSPLPWSSFEQRPHKFVRWFHARTQAPVLWIDPYPARFPKLEDFARMRRPVTTPQCVQSPPSWMRVVRLRVLPIEPLPALAHLNRFLWARLLVQITRFIESDKATIVFGKPSLLALQVLSHFPQHLTMYDAMDDFPSFHKGLAKRTMNKRECLLVTQVGVVWASSHKKHERLLQLRADVQLAPNGLDPASLPAPRVRATPQKPAVFGYVGTMAAWFDWNVVLALAKARPFDRIRLIGPLHGNPPTPLPTNVELLLPLPHAQALEAMNEFDVGLIPFRRSPLTDSVDPIKYYEYRALGLPVLSTEFGEMATRRGVRGVYLIKAIDDVSEAASKALADFVEPDKTFIREHSWDAIFETVKNTLFCRV